MSNASGAVSGPGMGRDASIRWAALVQARATLGAAKLADDTTHGEHRMNTSKPEPAPTGDGQPVWPTIMASVKGGKAADLIPHMQARHAFGLAKYGTPLRANNGRDPLIDAFQEALDLVAYLGQASMEAPKDAELDAMFDESVQWALRVLRRVEVK